MSTQVQQEYKGKKRRKGKGKGKTNGPRKPFVQQFGEGMMVSHDKHGLGAVTGVHKFYVSVHFFCEGKTDNVKTRELRFTREEQIRRSKLRRAFEAGSEVDMEACIERPLTVNHKIVHRLLGFGILELHGTGENKKLMLHFPENDYVEGAIEVKNVHDLKEVRQLAPAAESDEPKKKYKRRR